MFVFVFRCQITKPYLIDTVDMTHLSRRQQVEVRIMVKGKEAKLNIGSCGMVVENGKSIGRVYVDMVIFLRRI